MCGLARVGFNSGPGIVSNLLATHITHLQLWAWGQSSPVTLLGRHEGDATAVAFFTCEWSGSRSPAFLSCQGAAVWVGGQAL
jgi:hypothetical protein